jgi:hypothetical protein
MNNESTVAEKCFGIWRAVCEGRDVEFSWQELEALQEAGFITDLKRVHPYIGKKRGAEERWTFEWTDRLHDLAKALGKHTIKYPGDSGPTCKHGIAEGHCPECAPRDDTHARQAASERAEHDEIKPASTPPTQEQATKETKT